MDRSVYNSVRDRSDLVFYLSVVYIDLNSVKWKYYYSFSGFCYLWSYDFLLDIQDTIDIISH